MLHRSLVAAALLLMLASGLAPGLAAAQRGPASRPSTAATGQSRADTSKPRIKLIDMGQGEDLEGTVATGDGDIVTARGSLMFSNLVRVRVDFIDAIVKTADDLP